MNQTKRPRINRMTKLPIYNESIDNRINNVYKQLTGLTKPQAMKALSNDKLSDNWKNEIKCILFTVKMAGISSSIYPSYL